MKRRASCTVTTRCNAFITTERIDGDSDQKGRYRRCAPACAKLLQGIGWFEAFRGRDLRTRSRRLKAGFGNVSPTIVTPSMSPNGRMARSPAMVQCTGCRIFSWRGRKVTFPNYSCGDDARGQGLGRQLLRYHRGRSTGARLSTAISDQLRSRECYQRQFYLKPVARTQRSGELCLYDFLIYALR